MGKLILISGPNSSGKSRYAEKLVGKTQGKRTYIATMIAVNEENAERIEKHRAQRQNLHFETLELPYELAGAEAGEVVLLEDVSNLFANAFFEKGGSTESVFSDICSLKEKCRILIAVTISGLEAEGYEGETAAYIKGLNRLNYLLYDNADAAAKMENGEANWLKGEENDIF